MVYLNSTAIRSVEWNPDTRRMVIVFNGGNPYTYCGVPEWVYLGLISAASAGCHFNGGYFNQHVKGRYDC